MKNHIHRLIRRTVLVLFFLPHLSAVLVRESANWVCDQIITLNEWVHSKTPITRKFAK